MSDTQTTESTQVGKKKRGGKVSRKKKAVDGPKGVIKEKKKRSIKKNYNTLTTYVAQIQSSLAPTSNCKTNAQAMFSAMGWELAFNVWNCAALLKAYGGRKTLTLRDVRCAIQLLMPQAIARKYRSHKVPRLARPVKEDKEDKPKKAE